MSEKSTLSSASMLGVSGILAGIVSNTFLFIPGVGLGAIVGGAIGFVVSFIGLGKANKSSGPDMKFILPGLILNLLALGLGIYFRYFWMADQAPPDPDLLFLDSLN